MNDKIRAAFDAVNADGQLKEKTKDYISGQYQKRHRTKPFYYKVRYISVLSACAVFLLISFIGYRFYNTATSIVSIDINPSLELSINYFNQVIDVEGYNEDGIELADSLDILYCHYDEAIDEILNSETVQQCMANDEFLSIAVIGDRIQQSEEIVQYVNNCHHYQNSDCYTLTKDEVEEAHSVGLSYGKYLLYQQIAAVSDAYTPEEIQNMTMKEIRELMEQLGLSYEHHQETQDDHEGHEENNGQKHHHNNGNN